VFNQSRTARERAFHFMADLKKIKMCVFLCVTCDTGRVRGCGFEIEPGLSSAAALRPTENPNCDPKTKQDHDKGTDQFVIERT
jgi:hypothetical protein